MDPKKLEEGTQCVIDPNERLLYAWTVNDGVRDTGIEVRLLSSGGAVLTYTGVAITVAGLTFYRFNSTVGHSFGDEYDIAEHELRYLKPKDTEPAEIKLTADQQRLVDSIRTDVLAIVKKAISD